MRPSVIWGLSSRLSLRTALSSRVASVKIVQSRDIASTHKEQRSRRVIPVLHNSVRVGILARRPSVVVKMAGRRHKSNGKPGPGLGPVIWASAMHDMDVEQH